MSVNTVSKPSYQETPGGPFAKGNPGKPKGARHMTTKIMEAITRVSEENGTPEDVQIVRALIDKAKNGDVQAIKLIMNYTDGMPPQDIDVTSDGEKVLQGVIVLPPLHADSLAAQSGPTDGSPSQD